MIKDLNLRKEYDLSGKLEEEPSLDVHIWKTLVGQLDNILTYQIAEMEKIRPALMKNEEEM